jgi:hypothetical protein
VKTSDYLGAVARFLDADVRPALEGDRALAFRLRIASSLLQSVALETEHGGALAAAAAERAEELAAALRAGTLPPDREALVRSKLLEGLRARLAVVNPRFDTSPEIEP